MEKVKTIYIKFIFPVFLLFVCLTANAQQPVVNSSLKTVVTSLNNLRARMPIEKLYLQLSKPNYNLGDTLQFKAYLFDADFLLTSNHSGLLYLELDDMAGKTVKRIMEPLITGITWGDMAIDPKEISEGSYTLRAYTNWMRNFGEEYMYKRNIYISAVGGAATLVKSNFKLTDKGDKTNIQANLRFTDLNKQTLGLHDMQLAVKAGRRTLLKDKASTGIDGTMNINFDLADKAAIKDLAIQTQARGKGADTTKLTIPVVISRPENADVQFMPEGGNLVAGISSKVGFKAISEDGNGIQVSGKIVNSKQQEVAQFKTIHKGMGSFELMPQAGESYIAKVTLPEGLVKNYPLPLIKSAGTTLKVAPKGNDSLEISINITSVTAPATYYLIGQARGVICYAVSMDLGAGAVKRSIAKSIFPTGITRFTLLTSGNQPLNERIVYIDHDDNLQITITSNKYVYNLRDSIGLAVTVKDKDGKSVEGTFSMVVTDNDQVRPDTLGSNILNDVLFTSDLKGMVEEPGWYLENNSAERFVALDNLLLTQGWVGYDWKDVFDPGVKSKFLAEKEFNVEGKITNLFNKPIPKTLVTLLQKQMFTTLATFTDEQGRFKFKVPFPADSAYYLIEVKDKDGKNRNVGIEVDEFSPPTFSAPKQKLSPWYVNSDTTFLNNAYTNLQQLKAEAEYKGEGIQLKTVVINDKKIVPGSHNLNGPGEADFIIDEKDMEAEKKKTLAEVLKHKFPDFYKENNFGNPIYHLKGRKVVFVIDGMEIIDDIPLPVSVYMDDLNAEDIKGIEIMSNPKYAIAYNPGIISDFLHKPDRKVPLYLEITTYSDHGAFLKHMPGKYVYKPVGSLVPKDFYRPRYNAKNINAAIGTDLHSTIHWEPNFVTRKTGKGSVSFFSADKPAAYTVIMEGTDLNGSIGYKRQQIKVIQNTNAAK